MSRSPRGLPLVVMLCRGIGDVVWHLPTFRALAARSGGQIVLGARPSTLASDLLRAEPTIARFVELPQALPKARHLPAYMSIYRRERPAAIWVMERATVPSMAAFFAGIPERHGLGMKSRWQEIWLNTQPRLPRDARKLSWLDKLDIFDELHGLGTRREVDLVLDERLKMKIAAELADLPRPWVVFGVGASEPWRLWPLERFAEVAATLKDGIGTVFWLGVGADEQPVRAMLAGRTDQPNTAFWFGRPIHEGAVLMSLADAFMGPDSGPMNVAAAVRTPALGLYGPSPPLTYSSRLRAVCSRDDTMEGLSAARAGAALAPLLTAKERCA